ncbi:hypothetical protein PENSTE_c004G08592 [Penicillium steckii]|uniref:Uncharacterized protein n=1 Tax=Penicillium steckii TaxID=303698 RepID=A0A1V6TPQ6_9EURO|nr:hypothetical protein PENSTE_c004G08592 [Penicillium steckii]
MEPEEKTEHDNGGDIEEDIEEGDFKALCYTDQPPAEETGQEPISTTGSPVVDYSSSSLSVSESLTTTLATSATSLHTESTPIVHSTPEDIRNASYRSRAGPYCNHETFQRYWTSNPIFYLQCERPDCLQPARFLYECTADTAEYSPYVSSIPQRAIDILSKWIQKAIAIGHYTEAQVEKLLDQKMEVLESAASLREQVPPPSQIFPGGRGLYCDEEAYAQRDRRIEAEKNAAKTKDFSNIQPCRAMYCTMCRPQSADNAWGSIDTVVNEPYEEPLPSPANLYRPVTDGCKLRNLPKDPTQWQYTGPFQLWWHDHQYSAGNDLTPILDIIVALDAPFICLEVINNWVRWQQMPSSEFRSYLKWIETLNLEDLLKYTAQFGPSEGFDFQSENLSYTYLSPGTRSVPLSRHPIWEEVAIKDTASEEPRLVTIPDFGYDVWDRFAGRSWRNLRAASSSYVSARDYFLFRRELEGYPSAYDSSSDIDIDLETSPDIGPWPEPTMDPGVSTALEVEETPTTQDTTMSPDSIAIIA